MFKGFFDREIRICLCFGFCFLKVSDLQSSLTKMLPVHDEQSLFWT